MSKSERSQKKSNVYFPVLMRVGGNRSLIVTHEDNGYMKVKLCPKLRKTYEKNVQRSQYLE